MGVVDLPGPRVGPVSRLAPEPLKLILNWGRRYSLWVFNFGLACCAIEFIASSMARHDFIRLGVIPFAPGPRQADLWWSCRNRHRQDGARGAPAVRADAGTEVRHLVRRLLELRRAVLGLVLRDKGVDQIVPVDVYVPGPTARTGGAAAGHSKLQEKIAGESLGDRYQSEGIRVVPAAAASRLDAPLEPPRHESAGP